MQKKKMTAGVCQVCQGTFSKQAMPRHLTKCLDAQEAAATVPSKKAPKRVKLFHLLVQSPGAKEYWLHLEMPATATLRKLDDFLRDIWLECCGHLSAFHIGGTQFSVMTAKEAGQPWYTPDWCEERNMDVQVGKVFSPGMKFSYEYDFGSTTALELRVLGEREGTASWKEPVRLLARNEAPTIPCEHCEKPAVWIDTEEGLWLCEECIAEADECALPVVNSPRAGVCGYTG
jgi:hypothetical protein